MVKFNKLEAPEIKSQMAQLRFQFMGLNPIQMQIVREVMGNCYMDSEDYKSRRPSNPFLQGQDDQSGWILIEFWGTDKEEVVQWFLDYLMSQLNSEQRWTDAASYLGLDVEF